MSMNVPLRVLPADIAGAGAGPTDAARAKRAVGSAIVALLVAAVGWLALVAHQTASAGGPVLAGDGPPAADAADDALPALRAGAGGENAVSLGEPNVPLGHADRTLADALAAKPPVLAPLIDAAQRHGVDPRLVLSVAWHESRLKPGARSHAGAVGIMQVKPSTVERVARELGRSLTPLDPADNATAGVVYLRWLTDEFDDLREALIAYNQGSRALRQDGAYPSAAAYAEAVLETRADLERAGWRP